MKAMLCWVVQHRARLAWCALWSLMALAVVGGTGWANHIHVQEGPFGGIVLGVVADRAGPQGLYAVVYGGGVFKSTSGGQLWTGINRGLEHARVFSLVQDPAAPSVWYVGTDAGVWKTTSGGDQWVPARQGLEARNIRAIVPDPRQPARLFAATDAGVYRSDDGGGRWIAAREGLDHLDVRALAIDPTNSDVLYAGTFGGIFISRDGGQTWQATQAQPGDRQVRALVVDPHRPTAIYAGTSRGGIYQSTDGGAHRAHDPLCRHRARAVSAHSRRHALDPARGWAAPLPHRHRPRSPSCSQPVRGHRGSDLEHRRRRPDLDRPLPVGDESHATGITSTGERESIVLDHGRSRHGKEARAMSAWSLPKLGWMAAVAAALIVGMASSAHAGQVAQKQEILMGPYFETLKPGDSVEASIKRGEKLFNELGCAGCHPRDGSLGEGVTAVDVTGNRLPIPIPDLRGGALHYPRIAGPGFVATLGMLNDM
jgi:photosystem II stability/assembly factor-like uncharacterized protein